MKHDLERIEISFPHFSWVDMSSEKWVMIYQVYMSMLYPIFCYALQYREIGILPGYDDGGDDCLMKIVFSKLSKWILIKNFLEKPEGHKTTEKLYYSLEKLGN